jgi:hypothetical protein
VSVEASAVAHTRTAAHARLNEGEPGRYAGLVELPYGGIWELRLDVVRGEQHFFTTVRNELPLHAGLAP